MKFIITIRLCRRATSGFCSNSSMKQVASHLGYLERNSVLEKHSAVFFQGVFAFSYLRAKESLLFSMMTREFCTGQQPFK